MKSVFMARNKSYQKCSEPCKNASIIRCSPESLSTLPTMSGSALNAFVRIVTAWTTCCYSTFLVREVSCFASLAIYSIVVAVKASIQLGFAIIALFCSFLPEGSLLTGVTPLELTLKWQIWVFLNQNA